jgi:hypothetical protein
MKFSYTMMVEVRRTSGSKDDDDLVQEEIRQVLEEADPGEIFAGDSEYEVTDWSVTC